MRPLTGGELIELLDQASTLGPVERALSLLAKASPERTVDDLAQLSVGGRDRMLLQLREWTFGPRMAAVLRCPACEASLEINFDTADIRFGDAVPMAGPFELHVAGADLAVRLPTSLDLAALDGCADVTAGERRLLERCIWTNGGDRFEDELLTTEIQDAVDQLMAQADPQADIRLAATCPECDKGWLALFDIASFFWKEIRGFANQLMLDVHTLASTYGWAERDILAMNAWRRQRYVAMAQA
jgi:hypothetical protein